MRPRTASPLDDPTRRWPIGQPGGSQFWSVQSLAGSRGPEATVGPVGVGYRQPRGMNVVKVKQASVGVG